MDLYSIGNLGLIPHPSCKCICTGMWFADFEDSVAYRGDLFRLGETFIVNAVEGEEAFDDLEEDERILVCPAEFYFERRRVFVMPAAKVSMNQALMHYIRFEFNTTPRF